MPFNGGRTEWDTTFETNEPLGTDSKAEGDDHFRQLKRFLRERLNADHIHNTATGSGLDTGRHREGSARLFYQASDPTVLQATDSKGADALDEGRLLHRSDTGELKVYSGAAWVQAVRALSGTINLISTPLFQNGGADSMAIHAHGARHRPGGTSGVWTTPNDFVPYSLQRILSTNTIEGSSSSLPAAVLSLQVFGAANDSKAVLTVNTTGRPTTSRGVMVCEVTSKMAAGGTVANDRMEVGLFLDDIATQVGVSAWISYDDNVASDEGHRTMTFTRLVSGLTAASHIFALHVRPSDIDIDLATIQMIYYDYGTE